MVLVGFDAGRQASLVARGQSGDQAALEQLYRETFPAVFRWAMGAARHREDAEDIAAETFERALRVLPRYESRDVPIAAWLIRIAQNVAREHQSKLLRCRVVDIARCEVDDLPATTPPEMTFPIEGLLAQLTPAQREVVALRLQGLKVREIAAIQGRAEGTVKALQFAAVRSLRRAARC